MGFFDGTKRYYRLMKAYEFGREHYGVNLEKAMESARPLAIQQIETFGDPSPEAIFFMFVPAFLGQLDMPTRNALWDGMQSLFEDGQASTDIYQNFMHEWSRVAE